MTYVFAFDHPHDVEPMSRNALLGGKGANLAEMCSVLGLPVPPGFTITTEACRAYLEQGWPGGLDGELAAHLEALEASSGKRLGDPDDPLLVSVRSGAASSMPGMMDTVLNLGLNDRSVEGLAQRTNDERFAFDSYRRFIGLYARVVLDIDGQPFDEALDEAKERDGVTADSAISPPTLRWLCRRSLDLVHSATGFGLEQDPARQLRAAVEAVFTSWNGARAFTYRKQEDIDHSLGTAVNVQAMVFGNRDDNSGTGVAFTRDPSTGDPQPVVDFLVNAQGEDVVAGKRKTQDLDALRMRFPQVHAALLEVFERLEAHYRDMCDVEFTIAQGSLYLLQTRVGKRTPVAGLRMAVAMTEPQGGERNPWRITRDEAILRMTAEHLEGVLHPQFDDASGAVLTIGLGASPGAAVGRVCFSADAAADAADRGEPSILVRTETSPEDVHGMVAAEGILTARGGLVSHAAVVARGWGKPAVVGADAIDVGDHSFSVTGADGVVVVVREGDVISIDGSTGQVVLGMVAVSMSGPPAEFATLLSWADDVRGAAFGVRANADTGADAIVARSFGAEGIGLCRTEHMFLADDRLPVVRRMILASTPEEEGAALEELRVAQKHDFEAILEAMDGLPVTVRLLDPPLHEFLPDIEELAVRAAGDGLSPEQVDLLAAARSWRETNPMLGTRGVRLAVLKPGLYAMQVRALIEAAIDRRRAGGDPIVEVMIPLTVSGAEMELARSWVLDAVAEAVARGGVDAEVDVAVGTMIETPRAALRAQDLAAHADFFSFGTNDLTQMTFGFSRDDVEGRLMSAYLEQGLLVHNPFESIDADGVGQLVRQAVVAGRSARPGLKIGVCGEHGGDSASIAFFYNSGLDYVSCSPFRVPVARLSAAQAILRSRIVETPG